MESFDMRTTPNINKKSWSEKKVAIPALHWSNWSLLVYVSKAVREQLKQIITDSEIMQADDAEWPEPNRNGSQEIEIVLNDEHISFTVIDSDPCWFLIADVENWIIDWSYRK